MLDKEDVDAIALTTVARCRSTMRVVIGDNTPRQYDRADTMASAIDRAVRYALAECGVYEEEEQ